MRSRQPPTGPGGAGTSTVAASAAVRAARSGVRTLLISHQAPPVAGLDAVPGLEVARHRFGTDPGQAHLTLRVLRLDERYVE